MKDTKTKQTVSYGRRAASYWFVDGLPEIVLGLTLVAIAALEFLWRAFMPQGWNKLDWLIAGAGFIGYFLTERRILDFLKSHLTYPRTGYVQPPEEAELRKPILTTLSLRPEPPPSENVTLFPWRTVGLIWWVFWFFMVNGNLSGRWVVPVMMPVLAVLLYAVNRNSERPYRWWSSLILALTGPAFLLADIPVRLRRPVPLLLAGVWLLAEGGCALVRYLRENPPPTAVEGVRA
jgi:hypothetical protein